LPAFASAPERIRTSDLRFRDRGFHTKIGSVGKPNPEHKVAKTRQKIGAIAPCNGAPTPRGSLSV